MGELLDSMIAQGLRKARLPSLYSDFEHLKSTNPDGYLANVNEWLTALQKAANNGSIPGNDGRLTIRSGSKLQRSLESSEQGIPSSLGLVINEGVHSGRLMSQDKFLQSRTNIYEWNWVDKSLSFLSWSLQHLGVGGAVSTRMPEQAFVVLENLEEAGSKVLDHMKQHKGKIDRIIPINDFKSELSQALGFGEEISANDARILLTYLQRDKKHLVFNDQLVKLLEEGEKAEIVPNDVEIASVKALVADLSKQVQNISTKVEEASRKTKTALAEGRRGMALRYLRSRKTYEELLEKRQDTLSQIENAYNKIEEAANQVDVVEAMKGSTSVLKSLTAQTGGIENVERIIDGLHEEMANVDEIGQAIEVSNSTTAPYDEDALDDELKQMEAEEQKKTEDKEAMKTSERLAEIEKPEPTPAKVAEEPREGQKDEQTEVPKENIQQEPPSSVNAALEEEIAALDKLTLKDDTSKERKEEAREMVTS